MADYIDREAVLTEIYQYTRHYWPTVSYVESIIQKQPAADAVPIVRCRECVKRGTGECPMEQDYPWISTDSDAFCSYGERRDDNDEEP